MSVKDSLCFLIELEYALFVPINELSHEIKTEQWQDDVELIDDVTLKGHLEQR